MAITSGDYTLKLSGGSYSTWAGFWNDLGNLTGDITLTVDASAFTEDAAPAAVTETIGTYNITVSPVTYPTTTDGSNGARFTCNYTGYFLDNQAEGNATTPGTITVQGIVTIAGTSIPLSVYYSQVIGTDNIYVIRRNIIKGCANSTPGAVQNSDIDAIVKVYNNIFIDCGKGTRITNNMDANAFFANNTFLDSSAYGMTSDSKNNTGLYVNNLVYNSGTSDFAITDSIIGYNNACSDTSGEDANFDTGSANNTASISDPFTNSGADDVTLTSAGNTAIGAGLDYSAKFTTDFFGVTRTGWSKGACEYVAAAGQNVPEKVHYYQTAGGL